MSGKHGRDHGEAEQVQCHGEGGERCRCGATGQVWRQGGEKVVSPFRVLLLGIVTRRENGRERSCGGERMGHCCSVVGQLQHLGGDECPL